MSNEDSTLIEANVIELTAEIVAAYVANNAVQAATLPELIASVHASVAGLSKPVVAAAEALVPAVNPKKSVFPDYIVCLDDGKRFKSMRRSHCQARNDARRVSRQVGFTYQLSNGRSELRCHPV